MRGLVVFIIVLMGGTGIVTWWLPNLLKGPAVVSLPPGQNRGKDEMELPVPVRVFKATRIEFTDFLPTVGTVRGDAEVELKFELNGIIKSVDFKEGDIVKKGQVLAALDETDASARVAYAESKLRAAEAQLALAEKREEINQTLFDIGAIIRSKLEEAQLEVKQAEAQVDTARDELEIAKVELEKTVMKAPMDGVMGTREVEVGTFVSPQVIVGTIMDIRSVNVELGVIERDIERIKLGQRVKINVDSLPNESFQGNVNNLAPLIEGKSRTLTAKVAVPNPKGKLLPGMFARADIAVYEKPNALVIPTSSLKDSDGDGRFDTVFTVENEAAKMKPIVLGYLTTDYAEIREGIQEGEEVISEARGKLKEGSKVTLLETEEAGILRQEPELPGKQPEGPE
ncbi:MAG: efflux RND transporter periplasmic adaptor subunit [Candidatus Omnitrophica bacterium]|nr:efflux RND transporter periplasmic adaptor subunit [Candidatus Omnitrophota bacterium]